MKIAAVRAVRVRLPLRSPSAPPRRPSWAQEAEVANPLSHYPRFKRHRSLWLPQWSTVWCQVIAEDGTFGLGMTAYGAPVAAIINDHLAPLLVGEDALATEKLWDMMVRLAKPYGSSGLAAYAISAIDLALWDLKGKLLGKPVYALLGGPQKGRIFCYATGNDTDWHMELGFRATKLACPYGPADGEWGLRENERLVAQTRESVGDEVALMLDCWMALDVDYAVRLAERLRPYRLRWLEECLPPEDWEGHKVLRQRLPWQPLATGEHWYLLEPFAFACRHRVVDILQPDICWCGGLTACWKIAALAQAFGLTVILHAGGNTPFGQHFSFASPVTPWCEFFVGSAPGVPLEEATPLAQAGMAVPQNGWLVPRDAPGFGLEVLPEWIEPF